MQISPLVISLLTLVVSKTNANPLFVGRNNITTAEISHYGDFGNVISLDQPVATLAPQQEQQLNELYEQAVKFDQNGQKGEAITAYTELISARSKQEKRLDPNEINRLGVALLKYGAAGQATVQLAKAMKLREDKGEDRDYSDYYWRALAQFTLGNQLSTNRAAVLRHLSSIDDNMFKAADFNHSPALYYTNALKDIDTAISIAPTTDPQAFYWKSEIHNQLKQYPEAIDSLKQAMDIVRKEGEIPNPDDNISLGQLYHKNGQHDLAEKAYTQAIYDRKKYEGTEVSMDYYRRAGFYSEQERFREAANDLEKSEKLREEQGKGVNPYIRALKSNVHWKLGEYWPALQGFLSFDAPLTKEIQREVSNPIEYIRKKRPMMSSAANEDNKEISKEWTTKEKERTALVVDRMR